MIKKQVKNKKINLSTWKTFAVHPYKFLSLQSQVQNYVKLSRINDKIMNLNIIYLNKTSIIMKLFLFYNNLYEEASKLHLAELSQFMLVILT